MSNRFTSAQFFVFACLSALLVLTVWLAPHIGAVQHDDEAERQVLTNLRLPRLQMGMGAGAGLALAGRTLN